MKMDRDMEFKGKRLITKLTSIHTQMTHNGHKIIREMLAKRA